MGLQEVGPGRATSDYIRRAKKKMVPSDPTGSPFSPRRARSELGSRSRRPVSSKLPLRPFSGTQSSLLRSPVACCEATETLASDRPFASPHRPAHYAARHEITVPDLALQRTPQPSAPLALPWLPRPAAGRCSDRGGSGSSLPAPFRRLRSRDLPCRTPRCSPPRDLTPLAAQRSRTLNPVEVYLLVRPDLPSLPDGFVLRFNRRINVPGSLPFPRLAAHQTSWNHLSYTPGRRGSQLYFSCKGLFIHNYISCFFNALGNHFG